jgi:hypothetical protein
MRNHATEIALAATLATALTSAAPASAQHGQYHWRSRQGTSFHGRQQMTLGQSKIITTVVEVSLVTEAVTSGARGDTGGSYAPKG